MAGNGLVFCVVSSAPWLSRRPELWLVPARLPQSFGRHKAQTNQASELLYKSMASQSLSTGDLTAVAPTPT